MLARRLPRPWAAALLATSAAVLFGLTSILVRVSWQLLAAPAGALDVRLLVTALLGLAITLPTGVWSMQNAYVSGAPQLVICCLTLLDPLVAILGGQILLGEGAGPSPAHLALAAGLGLVAALGIVLLSLDQPNPSHPTSQRPPRTAPDIGRRC